MICKLHSVYLHFHSVPTLWGYMNKSKSWPKCINLQILKCIGYKVGEYMEVHTVKHGNIHLGMGVLRCFFLFF